LLIGISSSLLIVFLIWGRMAWARTYYALTNKRVIGQSGIIGRDFRTIDYDQITNGAANVGLVDKLFGNQTGTVLISAAQGSQSIRFMAINDPYQLFNHFKKSTYDIKSDLHYPNALRPD